MACRIFGAKTLAEPMLTYYKLDIKKRASVNFESKYKHFIWRMYI